MNYDIQTALEQLEQSLQKVDAARKEVDKVVNAYSELQSKTNGFVSGISTVSGNLQQIINTVNNERSINLTNYQQSLENLKNNCDHIVTKTKELLTSCSDDFTTKSEKGVNSLNEQIIRLKGEIDKTSSLSTEVRNTANVVVNLTSAIDSLQKELGTSQKAQDEAIANIDSAQKTMSNQLSDTDSTINNIVASLNGQDNTLAQLSQALSAANAKLKGLDTLLQGAQQALLNHTSNLNNQIVQNLSSLNDTIKEGQSTLQSKVGVLQILLIIQLVISVITLIVFFALK